MFSFLKRLSLRTMVVAEGADAAAPHVLDGLLRELPELLLACVVEVASGKILAQASYNPNHRSLRYARLLHTMHRAVASGTWPGGALTHLTLVLDNQLHHPRPLRAGQCSCLVAVHPAAVNLALTKKVVRRCAPEG